MRYIKNIINAFIKFLKNFKILYGIENVKYNNIEYRSNRS